MALIYSNLSDIMLFEDENMTDVRLNQSFNKLVENDRCLAQINGFTPGIWECKWFNNASIKGYNKGDAFWINTQSIDEIVSIKKEVIYEYAKNNPFLTARIKPYTSDSSIHELYKNIVSGYNDIQTGVKLSALYYLGDLSGCANIMISQVDDNKDYPSEDSPNWKKFFDTNSSKINETIEKVSKEIFDEHVLKYHNDVALINEELNEYADKSLSNVSENQHITSMIQKIHESGFDKIISSEYKTSTISSIIHTSEDVTVLSSTTLYWELSDLSFLGTYIPKDYQYLSSAANVIRYLENTHNYQSLKMPHWISITSSNTSQNTICDVKLKLVDGLEIEGYPTIVSLDQWGSISAPGIISNYNINQFYICKKQPSMSEVSSIQEHYDFNPNPNYPLTSTYKINDKYKPVEISSSFISSITHDQIVTSEVISSWYVLWNSGYLEQGGYHHLSNGDTITLLKPYSYQSLDKYNYYGNITKTSLSTINIDTSNTLTEDHRYTIQITPISEQMVDIFDIDSIKNDSFKVHVPDESKVALMYFTTGYKVQD